MRQRCLCPATRPRLRTRIAEAFQSGDQQVLLRLGYTQTASLTPRRPFSDIVVTDRRLASLTADRPCLLNRVFTWINARWLLTSLRNQVRSEDRRRGRESLLGDCRNGKAAHVRPGPGNSTKLLPLPIDHRDAIVLGGGSQSCALAASIFRCGVGTFGGV
jgi:hypothetical protein